MSEPGERLGAGCLVMALVLIIAAPLGGLAMSLCWNWFVAPIFDLPRLGIVAAIGIRVFLGTVIYPPTSMGDRERIEAMTNWGKVEYVAIHGLSPPLGAIAMACVWHVVEG